MYFFTVAKEEEGALEIHYGSIYESEITSRDVRQLGRMDGETCFSFDSRRFMRTVLARSPIHLSLYARDVVVHHRKSMDHLQISCVWREGERRMINMDGKGFLKDFFTKKIFKRGRTMEFYRNPETINSWTEKGVRNLWKFLKEKENESGTSRFLA